MFREWQFNLGPITLRAKRWGEPGGRPIIALHGWLDNCASFDFLAPRLAQADIVALDLAGQGKSDYRRLLGAYNIWQDLAEIVAVADQLGWKQFALLGHSRGAMISSLLAATFPERVLQLALIESFVPQALAASEAPTQLAAAIAAVLGAEKRQSSGYLSFDAAVSAREQGFMPLSHADAQALAQRGVEAREGRFYWRHDPKLTAPSEIKLTADQLRAFVDRISAPAALVVGDQGLMDDFPEMHALIAGAPNLVVHKLVGDHHLHMSAQSEAVANVFNTFFNS